MTQNALQKMSTVEIQPMSAHHLEEVWEIEKTAFSMPLSLDSFRRELTLPMARLRVAISDKAVVGYLNYWVIEKEAHVMTIAVHPEWRRHGVGKALFEFMIVETKDFESYHLELRVSNTTARAFYEKYGFKLCGLRKRYYANNGEDALLMSRYDVAK